MFFFHSLSIFSFIFGVKSRRRVRGKRKEERGKRKMSKISVSALRKKRGEEGRGEKN